MTTKLDELNKNVTHRIISAEQLEEVNSPYAKSAWLSVSYAEHYLANELEFGSMEWKIAWRGAISAAVKAGDLNRAENLIAFLVINFDIDAEMLAQLNALLP